jgi:anti-sigma factor RsiW
MRDTYQNEGFRCLDPEALVTYLYDEGDSAERAAVDAHVAICPACAEELDALRSTRSTLAAWSPPETSLGFQLARPRVLTSARWWARPLPAWAQAAAAVVIFASGVVIGVAQRSAAPAPAAATSAAAAPAAPAAVMPVASVTRQDLDAVAQQLRREIAETRQAPAPVPVAARANSDDMMRQVRALIAESEQRQQRTFALQTAQVVRQLDAQRRVDYAEMQRTVGQIQNLTGAAVRDQNQLVNYLINASQRR